MIGVICTLTVREESIDEFERLIREFKAAVDADEPGNLEYIVYREAAGVYTILEKFRDAAALKAHDDTRHKATISPQVGRLLAAKPEVRVLEPLA